MKNMKYDAKRGYAQSHKVNCKKYTHVGHEIDRSYTDAYFGLSGELNLTMSIDDRVYSIRFGEDVSAKLAERLQFTMDRAQQAAEKRKIEEAKANEVKAEDVTPIRQCPMCGGDLSWCENDHGYICAGCAYLEETGVQK